MKKHYKKQSKRKTNRPIKVVVKIYVDGPTEIYYWDRVNELELFPNIHIQAKKGSYDRYLYDYNNETTFLTLDIDNKQKHQKKEYELLEEACKNEKVFYNNYSFETFLLHHKIKTVGRIESKYSYDKKMRRHFGVDEWADNKCHNSRTKICKEITKESIEFCIANLKQYHRKNWNDNPSSNMDKLFDRLKEINDKSKI